MRRFLTLTLALLGISHSPCAASSEQDRDSLFGMFWAARSSEAITVSHETILASGTDPWDAYEMLRRGRAYEPSPPTGRLDLTRTNQDGTEHHYVVLIPESYDSSRRYPVRVYLHGGVRRPAWEPGGAWWRNYDPLVSSNHIAVIPSSWTESMWWQSSQMENLTGITDALKRSYNVDENGLYLFGVSDGGTGAYFFAFRNPTPWAGFLPFIAHPAVLNSPHVDVDGDTHLVNLTNSPLFIANAEDDRLYPVASMEPFLTLFETAGVEFLFRRQEGEHSVRWWPSEAATIEDFIIEHPRNPLPDALAWETERADTYNRIWWLQINALGATDQDTTFVDPDVFVSSAPSGRVEARRSGNNVSVATRGVRRYTLLISPDQFDLSKPFRITTNGRLSFDGYLEADLDVLMKWASRDNDRTMLFLTEITIDVGH